MRLRDESRSPNKLLAYPVDPVVDVSSQITKELFLRGSLMADLEFELILSKMLSNLLMSHTLASLNYLITRGTS